MTNMRSGMYNIQSWNFVCYTYLISCLSAWLECPKFQDCVLDITDLMFVIVAGMSKVPGLCVVCITHNPGTLDIPVTMTNMRSGMYNIQSWNHRGWNVQSSRIVCYTYLISCLSLWLECPKFQDCMLYIPDLMFVIVAGISKVPGLCVIHTWSHVCQHDCILQSECLQQM
jgi:hypothetical protein